MKSAIKLFFTSGVILVFVSLLSIASHAASYIDYFNSGNSFLDSWRFEEAIQSYDKAIELNSSIPEFYYNKGIALDRLGRFEEAVEQYDQVIKINKKYKQAYINK